jgi:hypothetical protein
MYVVFDGVDSNPDLLSEQKVLPTYFKETYLKLKAESRSLRNHLENKFFTDGQKVNGFVKVNPLIDAYGVARMGTKKVDNV